jgi:hypothetical protein
MKSINLYAIIALLAGGGGVLGGYLIFEQSGDSKAFIQDSKPVEIIKRG